MALPFIILRMLTKESLTGYDLVKMIEAETGWKPSYGSLYPVLNSMKKEGFVSLKLLGRRKIYSITQSGRKKLSEFEGDRKSLMRNVEKHMMVMNKCLGDKHSFVKNIFQMIRKGKMPFGKITSEAMELRNTLLRLSMQGKADKNPEKVKSILKRTIKELKKI